MCVQAETAVLGVLFTQQERSVTTVFSTSLVIIKLRSAVHYLMKDTVSPRATFWRTRLPLAVCSVSLKLATVCRGRSQEVHCATSATQPHQRPMRTTGSKTRLRMSFELVE